MIRPLKSLIGFKINAIDGEIGKVKDFYFDKITYTIRYLVVETGSFLFSRQILLSTDALLPTDWEKEKFITNLTIQQIENCPHADSKKTISNLEEELHLQTYYKWNNYRSILFKDVDIPLSEKDKPLLHSVNEIGDLEVISINSKVGHIRDVLIDDKSWKVNFLIIDAFALSPAREVMVPPSLINEFEAGSASVLLNVSSEAIKNSPEYFPDQLINL